MFYFFKIKRWQSIKDHRSLKYSKYVIGEIFIVIIGILLAIQINNWNEQKRKDLKKQVYIERLNHDLARDTINLNSYIASCEKNIRFWRKTETRIEKPNLTIDSILDIATSMEGGGTHTLSELNSSTFNSLLSTGDIDLFQEDHLVMLMDFYAIRERSSSMLLKIQENSRANWDGEFNFLFMKDKTSLFYKKQEESFDEAKFLRKFYFEVKSNAQMMHGLKETAHYGLVQTREVLKMLNNPKENSYSDISHIFK